jgi:hypothetical protein
VPRHAQAARLRQTLAQVQTFAISRRMLYHEQGQCHHQNVSECASRWVAGVTVSRDRQADAVRCRGLLGTLGGWNECWGTNVGRLSAGGPVQGKRGIEVARSFAPAPRDLIT